VLKPFLRWGLPVVLCVAWLALPSAAAATTQALVVTTTADTDQLGVGECASAGPCTLREAVNQADLDTNDTIVVPYGLYALTPAYGPLVFTGDTTVTGNTLAPTVISGAGGTRIMEVEPTATVTLGDLTLEDGDVSGNGGAALVETGGGLALEDDTVSGNTASGSGGGVEDEGSMAVLDSTITGNQAPAVGGVDDDSTGTLLVVGSTFSDNTGGGGLLLGGGGPDTAAIADSTFASNSTSGEGGGIDETTPSTLTLSDSTLYGNSAVDPGGGIATSNSSTNTLVNDTIADNTSSGGGQQLANFGSASALNTILSGSGSSCAENDPTDAGHNLDSSNSCGFSSADGDLINTDPDLGPLESNGGPTDTMALLAGSPAINAGSNSGCPATDQRGVARPQQGLCDIGAYEFAPAVLQSGSATGVTQTGATLSATASNPDAQGAKVTFQYGKSTSYGSAATASLPALANSPASASVGISGLAPKTTYHYRVVVSNAAGTEVGSDEQFTTSAVPHTFKFGTVRVSAKGLVRVPVTLPWPGRVTATATFTVRVKKRTKTFRYGTASVKRDAAGTATLKISVRGKAAKELEKLGHVVVTISVAYAPSGGTSHTERHKITVRRSKRGKYS
jgi:CSLREA domain-containing protein